MVILSPCRAPEQKEDKKIKGTLERKRLLTLDPIPISCWREIRNFNKTDKIKLPTDNVCFPKDTHTKLFKTTHAVCLPRDRMLVTLKFSILVFPSSLI